MREKALRNKNQKEKYKVLAVILFFFVSGVFYSHSFHSGSLDIGNSVGVEEIGMITEESVFAENVLGKIDINTASIEELTVLSGIGENRAADIIQYREQNGNFSHIEDIMKVSGIGGKTFEEIKDKITVGE